MRTLSMAAVVLAAATLAGGANAQQRVMAHGPAGHPPMMGHPMGAPGQHGGRHWGGKMGGHWWGGMRAPGGWGAYRRPVRGYVLPGYWIAPGWGIGDWSGYGLPQPPAGYNWSRYYDDAVLIDGRGSVYDTVGGIDWDRYDQGYADSGYGDGDDQGGYAGQPGASYGYPDGPDHRNSGVGGALVGGAIGGVAGNVIAGHGDKLGGTLVGAGAGALAGYAIDRGSDRHDRRGPPPYRGGPGYGRGPGNGAPYPMPPRMPYPPSVIHDGDTTVTTTTSGGYAGGSYVNGWYYPGATVTTVTIASTPVVTTTTEVFEDTVTYSRPHKVWRKRVGHPRPKCSCRAPASHRIEGS